VLPAMVLSLILENKNGKKVEEENKKKKMRECQSKACIYAIPVFFKKVINYSKFKEKLVNF
jgi:hypothetical protein